MSILEFVSALVGGYSRLVIPVSQIKHSIYRFVSYFSQSLYNKYKYPNTEVDLIDSYLNSKMLWSPMMDLCFRPATNSGHHFGCSADLAAFQCRCYRLAVCSPIGSAYDLNVLFRVPVAISQNARRLPFGQYSHQFLFLCNKTYAFSKRIT